MFALSGHVNEFQLEIKDSFPNDIIWIENFIEDSPEKLTIWKHHISII